jgi:hypothetical protein
MAKAKFDSAKMKQALGANAEKIGFGVAFVLMAWLIYSAFGVKPYTNSGSMNAQAGLPTEPKELADLVKRIELRVTGPENKTPQAFNPAADGVVLPGEEPKKVIDRLLLADVSPALFSGIEWNKPLFDQKQRRREPEFLALRDLRAAYHHAAVEMNQRGAANNAGTTVSRGREWITVTGIVPLEDQTIEFAKAFQNALDTTTNAQPQYDLYQLQRVVVNYDDVGKPVDWEKAEVVDYNAYVTEEMGAWGGTGPEYVAPKFARAPLTQPLPLLSNNNYGDWAAHAPEIPAAGGGSAAGQAPAARVPGQTAPSSTAEEKAKPPQYLLFRFLDFKVEARKFYRYRVKLIVKNPNFGLEGSHLEKPDLAQGETRDTQWSPESAPVGVPIHERFFAGGVPTVSGEAEPSASVGVRKWHPPLGSDIYYDFADKYRGASLNHPSTDVAYVIPRDMKGTKGNATVKTDAMLADFAWEKNTAKIVGPMPTIPGQQPRPCLHPAELLVMNGRGELLIQTELGDMPLRDEMKQVEQGGSGPAPGNGGAMGVGVAPAGAAAATSATGTTTSAAPTPTPSGTAPEDPRRVLRLK